MGELIDIFSGATIEGSPSKRAIPFERHALKITPAHALGVEMIARFIDVPRSRAYSTLIGASTAFLNQLHAQDSVRELFATKRYFWNCSTVSDTLAVDFPVSDDALYGRLLEEHGKSPYETSRLLFDIYIQSFVDRFNDLENGPMIAFPKKDEMIREARHQKKKDVVEVLSESAYLIGFSERGYELRRDRSALDARIDEARP